MKLLIEQSLDIKEPEITIKCGLMDERLKKLIEQIRLYSFSVMGFKDGSRSAIALENIYYFESVDNKTFLYTSNEVYECDKKLYELEESLKQTSFVRVSKKCILNSNCIKKVRPQLSGRIEAILDNDEHVIVSKHYTKDFKEKFI
ncbi:LytTR family DNA-binding domain-containing protein [Anaerofustis stercorihominis]|uniref:LytTr DNA-binding domain protein n=2 Tax=Anaerofustis stercorihominis TaxID=214853 RepID=B1C6R8_9FIRM|nr:LytTR family DNA-binding domain-containing protein [Anaerofustis stercorihominis]EDS72705.1 LytTr DNA-binding domain protein [Anaerofustis stercorihominis DSM 17244]MCQ4794079.1 LytTR family transcriptional regulator [Anaerofustis stercorihominis]RGD74619.1 LytTR family transcriptional regulator [Anaerofustis stercorihominis]